MINERPSPIRCAVCNRTGPQAMFRRAGWPDMNWVEAHGGTYMVCNDHIDTVRVEEGFTWLSGVRFSSESTLRDLERRISELESRQ